MNSSLDSLWTKTLELIQDSGFFEDGAQDWLCRSTLFKIEDGKAYVSYRSIITSNLMRKNLSLFEETLSELWGSALKISLLSQKETETMMPGEKIRQKTSTLFENRFDSNYTFDSFVRGPSNQEALMACREICKPKSRLQINPLLIYGNSGLGKTHLLNAIGNELIKNQPEKRVLFMYSGDLVNLMMEAMKSKNSSQEAVERLKEQLLSSDYFLVDDIQNLRSMGCQEIFFTVYNELIRQKKKIILTSDVHPSNLASLAKRLISRFNSGLTVCISKPEANTAKAIIKKKLEGHEDTVDIEDEVLNYLAASYSSDVRLLEGKLNRLLFNMTLFNAPSITMEFALSALRDEPLVSEGAQMEAGDIKRAVARYYGLSIKDLEGKSRIRKIACARQICMYLMREDLQMAFTVIGQEIGGRDHTTVSSAINKARKQYESNADYKQAVEAIRASLPRME